MEFVVFLFTAYIGISTATTNSYPRGCIYANGRCIKECPVGTLGYSIGCGIVTREATCTNPRPRPDTVKTCGYSACHCVQPKVRDESTGQCVSIEKCPGVKIIYAHGGGKVKLERKNAPGSQLPQLKQLPQLPQLPRLQRPNAPVTPVEPTAPFAPTAPAVPVAPNAQLYRQLPQLQQLPQLPQLPQLQPGQHKY